MPTVIQPVMVEPEFQFRQLDFKIDQLLFFF